MTQTNQSENSRLHRRGFVALASGIVAGAMVSGRVAAQPPGPSSPWSQPVHHVANANLSASTPAQAGDPNLRRGLQLARQALVQSREDVRDYTAVLVKRERIGQTLGDYEYMSVKVRNRKIVNGQIVQPFSVYVGFEKPSSVKGREVIYVENQNDGKMVAHEGGLKGRFLPTVSLPVDGMLAMRGQRYPMTDIGVENLIVKLIERGEKAIQFDDVTAEFRKGARVKDRVCTVLQVNQPVRRPELDFCQAQVFLDDQLNMPIRYIAYDWPAAGTPAGTPGQVIEEYNYLNLQVNVGLTDADFDPYNNAYGFHN